MKISALALSKVNTPNVRRELSGVLRCTEQTIIRYIRKNESNGPLTTMASVIMIEELTGLSTERIIDKEKAKPTKIAAKKRLF